MGNLSFSIDQKFLEGGIEYRLQRFFSEGRTWQVENVLTGDITKRPLDELHEHYRTMKLTLIVDPGKENPLAERIGRVILPDRPLLSPSQLRHAKRLESYLKKLDERGFFSSRFRDLKKDLADIAREIGDKAPPSPKTILRARRKWLECGHEFRCLLPRFGSRGRRNRFSPAVEWLIQKSLKSTYLTQNRKKITDAWKLLDQCIQAINTADPGLVEKRFTPNEREEASFKQLQDQAPIAAPSKFALYRRVHSMSLYDILVARFGKRYADKVFRTTFPGEMPARPLARVDGDETTTDLFVIDEIHHLWLGRLYATVLYEAYCRAVYGFYLGFEPHSVLAYMRAIRHGVLPKTYIQTEYPVIKNHWDIHGVAELYNLDNAMAVHSKDFEKIAEDLNSIILFDPPATPWFKGMVERFFRDLNEKLLHTQQGTSFSHMADLDGDYDPTKNAVIPYGLLMLMFHEFVVDIQLQNPNSGISDLPALRWAKHASELPPPVPPTAADLNIILGRRIEKPVWHYGIEIDQIFYQSDELGALRKRMSRIGMANPIVQVNAPPGDLEYIYVFDPDAQKYIQVPAAELSYAKGLSRHAHLVHLQYCKKYLNGVTDVHALTQAQVQIWDWAAEAGRLNTTFGRYMENHARENPAGPLIASELLTKMVDKMAGKPETPAIPPRPKPIVKKDAVFADLPTEKLPVYETSETLPDLSSQSSRRELDSRN